MINSRRITDLHIILQNLCKQHIAACAKRGVTITVTSTLRDNEYQASLYAQGRTKPGQIVTNMKLVGPHGFGLAYDVVPIANKVAVWNDSKLWQIVGEEGRKLGLTWGGDWKSFIDKPHFELTEGLTGTQLRSGKRPSWWKRDTIQAPTIPTIWLEDKPLNVPIKIEHGVSYAVTRPLCEQLGFIVLWDNDNKRIIIKKPIIE